MVQSISKSKGKVYMMALIITIFASFTTILPNMIKAMTLAVALPMTFYAYGGLLHNGKKPIYLLFGFFLVELLWTAAGYGGLGNMNGVVMTYISLFNYVILSMGLPYLQKRQLRLLFIFFLLCLIEQLIVTSILSQLSPEGICRTIFAANGEMDGLFAYTGLMDYGFGQCYCALIITFAVLCFEHPNRFVKALSLIVLLAIVYVLYRNTVTTSLLIGLVFCVFVVVYYVSKGNKSRIIAISAIIALLLVPSAFLSDFFSDVGGKMENRGMAEKFENISDSMHGEKTGQVEGRSSRYEKSISVFLRNPVLGLAEKGEEFANDRTPGNHSTLLDLLAYYGLFALFLFAAWRRGAKETKKQLSGLLKGSWSICMLSIVLLSIVKGGIHIYIMFLTFIILKILYLYMDRIKVINN